MDAYQSTRRIARTKPRQIITLYRRFRMSKKVQINTEAPFFELDDFNGNAVNLSDYRGHKHVVLVFNRGFM